MWLFTFSCFSFSWWNTFLQGTTRFLLTVIPHFRKVNSLSSLCYLGQIFLLYQRCVRVVCLGDYLYYMLSFFFPPFFISCVADIAISLWMSTLWWEVIQSRRVLADIIFCVFLFVDAYSFLCLLSQGIILFNLPVKSSLKAATTYWMFHQVIKRL